MVHRFLIACLGGAAIAWTGAAATPVRVSDGAPRTLAEAATGEQIVLDRRSGPLAFAGRSLTLDDCIGVAGYASEVAYFLVVTGSAHLGEVRATPGQMLLLPPYGEAAGVERFDAGRLRSGWSPAAETAAPEAYAALSVIARKQARALFAGRYQRTRFNVAASGGAATRETGRRAMVGGAAVRAIRFGGEAPAMVEQRVVERLTRALRERDAETTAELMDPLAFGGDAIGGAGAGARQLFARALVAQRDWGAWLDAARITRAADNRWLVTGAGGETAVTLRATPDFAFVRAISTGDDQ